MRPSDVASQQETARDTNGRGGHETFTRQMAGLMVLQFRSLGDVDH